MIRKLMKELGSTVDRVVTDNITKKRLCFGASRFGRTGLRKRQPRDSQSCYGGGRRHRDKKKKEGVFAHGDWKREERGRRVPST